ncbi:DUF317 domain-containing protein [Streptacidiphilus sp. MAP5-52]|uniref:DUF317 domain-containing protein n=1 Tax=Streptacidiphilus sp. MAP5-52 TaxID=3156267 RepID=UPI003514E891
MTTTRDVAADPKVLVSPGYLAGPGDSDTALAEFLDQHPAWTRYSLDDERSVAVHDGLSAKLQLDHDAVDRPKWRIAYHDEPTGELTWHVDFCPRTPAEVVMATAHQLSLALDRPTPLGKESVLGTGQPLRETAVDVVTDGTDVWAWWEAIHDRRAEFAADDGTAGLIHHRPQTSDHSRSAAGAVLWGGPKNDPARRWKAWFSPATPSGLIIAALYEVTLAIPAVRRASQIPAGLTAHVRVTRRPTRRQLPLPSRETGTILSGHGPASLNPRTEGGRTARRPR